MGFIGFIEFTWFIGLGGSLKGFTGFRNLVSRAFSGLWVLRFRHEPLPFGVQGSMRVACHTFFSRGLEGPLNSTLSPEP